MVGSQVRVIIHDRTDLLSIDHIDIGPVLKPPPFPRSHAKKPYETALSDAIDVGQAAVESDLTERLISKQNELLSLARSYGERPARTGVSSIVARNVREKWLPLRWTTDAISLILIGRSRLASMKLKNARHLPRRHGATRARRSPASQGRFAFRL